MGAQIITLSERKARETARRAAAAAAIAEELRHYAAKHRGRFVLFGSAAKGAMQYDSDLDVAIDFPSEADRAAWSFVEGLCAKHAIPADLHNFRSLSERLRSRILPYALTLP